MKKTVLSLALACACLSANASTLPDYPFIHTSGTAFVFVLPDMGEVDFELNDSDAAPDAARARIDSRLAAIREQLVAQGLAAEAMEVRDVRKEARKGDGVVELKCYVHIVVRDLGRWSAVVQPLIDAPGIDGLSVSFDTVERDKIQSELLDKAVKDARRRAEAIAHGFGRHAGAVSGISTGDLKNVGASVGLIPGQNYPESTSRKRAEGSDLLMITALKMAQAVDVLFRIK